MNTKMYYRVTATIFTIIAIGHAVRLAYGWDAVIGDVTIPLWMSGVGVLIAGYLACRGFTIKK